MSALHTPLTIGVALSATRWEPFTLAAAAVVLAGYWLCWRRSTLPVSRAVVFTVLGVGVWVYTTISFVGIYSDVLFWVRALQFVLLMMVAPFGLALGMPLTALSEAVSTKTRTHIDDILSTRAARVLTSPPATSAALLILPWLIYFTGWYQAILRNDAVDIATRLLMVAVGFGYFYTRLQLDPVPRHYPQGVSLGITVVETIGDGILGIILWQGGLVAYDYYAGLGRTWGPDLRLDQTIGAGMLWILGDVIGLPFLMVLFARFRSDEAAKEEQVDAQLDAAERDRGPAAATETITDEPSPSTLWWENDPELRDRFR